MQRLGLAVPLEPQRHALYGQTWTDGRIWTLACVIRPATGQPVVLGYVIGAWSDFPTTAAHLLPRISPPAAGASRRVCCAMTFSGAARTDRWSERRIVTFSIRARLCRRPVSTSQAGVIQLVLIIERRWPYRRLLVSASTLARALTARFPA